MIAQQVINHTFLIAIVTVIFDFDPLMISLVFAIAVQVVHTPLGRIYTYIIKLIRLVHSFLIYPTPLFRSTGQSIVGRLHICLDIIYPSLSRNIEVKPTEAMLLPSAIPLAPPFRHLDVNCEPTVEALRQTTQLTRPAPPRYRLISPRRDLYVHHHAYAPVYNSRITYSRPNNLAAPSFNNRKAKGMAVAFTPTLAPSSSQTPLRSAAFALKPTFSPCPPPTSATSPALRPVVNQIVPLHLLAVANISALASRLHSYYPPLSASTAASVGRKAFVSACAETVHYLDTPCPQTPRPPVLATTIKASFLEPPIYHTPIPDVPDSANKVHYFDPPLHHTPPPIYKDIDEVVMWDASEATQPEAEDIEMLDSNNYDDGITEVPAYTPQVDMDDGVNRNADEDVIMEYDEPALPDVQPQSPAIAETSLASPSFIPGSPSSLYSQPISPSIADQTPSSPSFVPESPSSFYFHHLSRIELPPLPIQTIVPSVRKYLSPSPPSVHLPALVKQPFFPPVNRDPRLHPSMPPCPPTLPPFTPTLPPFPAVFMPFPAQSATAGAAHLPALTNTAPIPLPRLDRYQHLTPIVRPFPPTMSEPSSVAARVLVDNEEKLANSLLTANDAEAMAKLQAPDASRLQRSQIAEIVKFERSDKQYLAKKGRAGR